MSTHGEPLIRLTPSGRRAIRASRPQWGWRPGLPVLVSRQDDDFGFGVPRRGDGPVIDFTSLGVRLAVPEDEADHFRGSVLSANHDALFERNLWWLENPNDPGRSGCSDPLGASCCPARFRRLHPELFSVRGLASRLLCGVSPEDRDQIVARTSAYLRWGDGRAAVVMRTTPLLVAAYCDEMDAVMLLRFPGFLVEEHGLAEGTRLVTANLHRPAPGKVARDIVPGPAYLGRYVNVRPLVADFLAAEGDRVEARRRAIAEREYRRCEELGGRALEAGQPVRSGRPLEAATPGTRRWDEGA